MEDEKIKIDLYEFFILKKYNLDQLLHMIESNPENLPQKQQTECKKESS